jgi:hypothetical protein
VRAQCKCCSGPQQDYCRRKIFFAFHFRSSVSNLRWTRYSYTHSRPAIEALYPLPIFCISV